MRRLLQTLTYTPALFLSIAVVLPATASSTIQMIESLTQGDLSLADLHDHLAHPDLSPHDEQDLHHHLKKHFHKHGLKFIGLTRAQQSNPPSMTQVLEAKPAKTVHSKKVLKTLASTQKTSTPTKAPLDHAPFIHSGKLVISQGDEIVSCTAHMISPEILLTAAHCFDSEYQVSQITWYQAFDRGMFLNEVKPVWIAHNQNYEEAIKEGITGIRHPSEEDRDNAIDPGFDYVLLGIPKGSATGEGNPLHCFNRGGTAWKPRSGIQIGYGANYGSNNELYQTEVTIEDVDVDRADPLAKAKAKAKASKAWTIFYNGKALGEGSSGGPFLFAAPGTKGKDGMVVSSSLTGVVVWDDKRTQMTGPAFLADSNFTRFLKAHKITGMNCQ